MKVLAACYGADQFLRNCLNKSDENLHMEAAAWLFRTQMKEEKDLGLLSEEYLQDLKEDIVSAATKVYEHEKQIIAKLFEKGPIEGITATQLEHFAKSRINLVLRNLGYEDYFEVDYNPVGEWFYKGINGYSSTDFFNSQGNQYTRGWNAEEFEF